MDTFEILRAGYIVTVTFEQEADTILWTAGVFFGCRLAYGLNGTLSIEALQDRLPREGVKIELYKRIGKLLSHSLH
jgi:hypothetical protein